jgi:Na+/melibiose symporter-like transporter
MYAMAFCAINFLQGNIFLFVKYVLKEEAIFPYVMFIVQVRLMPSQVTIANDESCCQPTNSSHHHHHHHHHHQGTAAISLPAWAWISNWLGKKYCYILGMIPFNIACLCLMFLPGL